MSDLLKPENWEHTKAARMEHWRRIRLVRAEWSGTGSLLDYIEDTYGLKLHKDQEGNITDSFEIVNEQKYSFFLLKYA